MLGIEEVAEEGTLAVFPNPTEGIVNITYEGSPGSEFLFTIQNTVGQLIINETIRLQDNSYSSSFDLSSYPSGIYFITVQSEKGILTEKVFVK